VLLAAVAAPLLVLSAAICHEDEAECPNPEVSCVITTADSVVIEPSSDSVVIEPAASGAASARLAVDSVVIEPTAGGRRTVRIYPR
jgi:hypothetical protein